MFRVQNGQVLCYRLYDIADRIDLEKAGAVLLTDTRRVTLKRAGSEFIQLSNPPIHVSFGKRSLALKGGVHEVEVGGNLFDHGAISIIVTVPIASGTDFEALIPFCDELYDSPEVDKVCEEMAAQLRKTLGATLHAEHSWDKNESYAVIHLTRVEGDPSAAELVAAPELPRLLLGEVQERDLSQAERDDVIRHHFSYTQRDLAVVDWNAAFVYEPSGSMDIPDLLEIANAQLLELRYYDDVLDRELSRVYDAIDEKRTGPNLLRSPYSKMLRELMLTLMELHEFVERVENSLKIVGDVYLARVYEESVKQLRIPAWQGLVTRKQKLLVQTYELLKGEVDTRRALTLEFMVVVLIVLEIVLALTSVVKH
jgi:hypothetical protein